MTIRTKKIAGLLLFLIFSTTAVMAQAEQKEVTDAELSKFATTFQKMRMMNQKAQQQMTAVIEDEGIEIKRFNEIHQATMDPAVEVDASKEEQEKYEVIIAEIERLQPGFQKKMQELVAESGLSMERYEQIATKLQTDPQLQERLRNEFQE